MDVLGQLEGSTDRKYESVVPFFEQKGLAMSILAPSATIEVDSRASVILNLYSLLLKPRGL
jgi:hypothetical protein